MKIEKRELNQDLMEIMEQGYAQEEKKYNIVYNYIPFSFVASQDDIVMGIISGYTCYKEIYIDDLMVVEKYRGNGIGTKLITQVEEYFSGQDFNNINLCTNGFQAPKFYEKCGFELEFIRRNKTNSLLDKYFFVKFLN